MKAAEAKKIADVINVERKLTQEAAAAERQRTEADKLIRNLTCAVRTAAEKGFYSAALDLHYENYEANTWGGYGVLQTPPTTHELMTTHEAKVVRLVENHFLKHGYTVKTGYSNQDVDGLYLTIDVSWRSNDED